MAIAVTIADGKLFTTGNFPEGQKVIAANAADGTILWATPFTERAPKHGYEGARSSPSIDGDRLYVVDGTEANCLYIMNIKDGKIVDKVEGLKNATAVTVDANDNIYIGEVNGQNVKKLVRKK